jgi:hypothetical protein
LTNAAGTEGIMPQILAPLATAPPNLATNSSSPARLAAPGPTSGSAMTPHRLAPRPHILTALYGPVHILEARSDRSTYIHFLPTTYSAATVLLASEFANGGERFPDRLLAPSRRCPLPSTGDPPVKVQAHQPGGSRCERHDRHCLFFPRLSDV